MKLPLSYTTAKSPLQPRQDGGGGGDCSCMDGGTIAGIIIGSVAGILLLIWLIRTACALNPRKPGDVDGHETRRTYYSDGGGGSRGRRRGSRGSSYVSYRAEKPSKSRRYRERDYDVQRPAKVYAV